MEPWFIGSIESMLDEQGVILPHKLISRLVLANATDMPYAFIVHEKIEGKIYSYLEWVPCFSETVYSELEAFMANKKIKREATHRLTISEGRLEVPEHMRKALHLDELCVVVGAGNHYEIWNPKEYREYLIGMKEK